VTTQNEAKSGLNSKRSLDVINSESDTRNRQISGNVCVRFQENFNNRAAKNSVIFTSCLMNDRKSINSFSHNIKSQSDPLMFEPTQIGPRADFNPFNVTHEVSRLRTSAFTCLVFGNIIEKCVSRRLWTVKATCVFSSNRYDVTRKKTIIQANVWALRC